MFTDFDGVEIRSCNSILDLPAGTYRERQTSFVSPSGDREMLLRTYKRDGDESSNVVDCVVFDAGEGCFYFEDFVYLEGGWRAGSGLTSESLLSLLPEGASDFVQVGDEIDGDVIDVGVNPGSEVV